MGELWNEYHEYVKVFFIALLILNGYLCFYWQVELIKCQSYDKEECTTEMKKDLLFYHDTNRGLLFLDEEGYEWKIVIEPATAYVDCHEQKQRIRVEIDVNYPKNLVKQQHDVGEITKRCEDYCLGKIESLQYNNFYLDCNCVAYQPVRECVEGETKWYEMVWLPCNDYERYNQIKDCVYKPHLDCFNSDYDYFYLQEMNLPEEMKREIEEELKQGDIREFVEEPIVERKFCYCWFDGEGCE